MGSAGLSKDGFLRITEDGQRRGFRNGCGGRSGGRSIRPVTSRHALCEQRLDSRRQQVRVVALNIRPVPNFDRAPMGVSLAMIIDDIGLVRALNRAVVKSFCHAPIIPSVQKRRIIHVGHVLESKSPDQLNATSVSHRDSPSPARRIAFVLER